MTENKPIAKSPAIKDVLSRHPKASPTQVVEILAKSGVSVSRNHIATVLEVEKTKMHNPTSGITVDTSDVNLADSEVKMSGVILKLAEPLLRKCEGNDQKLEGAIVATIVVWNKLLLPEARQSDIDKKIIDAVVPPDGPAEDVGTLVEMTELITERRNRYFPDLKQLVVNYDLQVSERGMTLNVSSVPIKPRT